MSFDQVNVFSISTLYNGRTILQQLILIKKKSVPEHKP